MITRKKCLSDTRKPGLLTHHEVGAFARNGAWKKSFFNDVLSKQDVVRNAKISEPSRTGKRSQDLSSFNS
jgi:hypothetical protein